MKPLWEVGLKGDFDLSLTWVSEVIHRQSSGCPQPSNLVSLRQSEHLHLHTSIQSLWILHSRKPQLLHWKQSLLTIWPLLLQLRHIPSVMVGFLFQKCLRQASIMSGFKGLVHRGHTGALVLLEVVTQSRQSLCWQSPTTQRGERPLLGQFVHPRKLRQSSQS